MFRETLGIFGFFREIAESFNTIRLALSGESIERENVSPEVKKIRKEVYNLEIPHQSEDRVNLKKDRDAVSGDYRKAAESKKLELQY